MDCDSDANFTNGDDENDHVFEMKWIHAPKYKTAVACNHYSFMERELRCYSEKWHRWITALVKGFVRQNKASLIQPMCTVIINTMLVDFFNESIKCTCECKECLVCNGDGCGSEKGHYDELVLTSKGELLCEECANVITIWQGDQGPRVIRKDEWY